MYSTSSRKYCMVCNEVRIVDRTIQNPAFVAVFEKVLG
jgi:hypothetical protein